MSSWSMEWQQERAFDQNCEMELRKANNETIPILPNQLRESGASYQGQAAAEATEWQNGPHGCYVKQFSVERGVFQFPGDAEKSVWRKKKKLHMICLK